jgi:phospholipid-binding lipoprotein MlaA
MLIDKRVLLSLILILNFVLVKGVLAEQNADQPRAIETVMNAEDPYEDFNRSMFEFNLKFNDAFGRPLANVYNSALPQPARTGISNVFNNLTTPISAINCFLQGKVEDGFSEIMRFSLNSTFGLLGLIDIAEPAGITAKNEDFGQTLYHWGLWDQSSYLVLPILGPYTTRELAGSLGDSVYDPVYPTMIDADQTERITIRATDGFITYARVINIIEDVKTQPDPYIFSRESYLQIRTNDIYDGNTPQPSLDDFDFE